MPADDTQPEVLAPWIVVESAIRPDATPVRATAVLPADAWSGRSVGTLADALRETPGAILQESFGGFEPPRISIRGSGIQSAPSSRGVTLLLNQLPLGLADGSFNSALVDPMFADRINVQRGIDGWRASPVVGGGALDFRLRLPDTSATGARFETSSFGAMRGRATGTWVGARATASAGVSFARQDGFRDHSGQARTALLGALSREFAADANARVEIYHVHARYDVPGPLTWVAAMGAPRSISAEVRRDQPGRESEITRFSASFSRRDATQEFELGAALARTSDDFRQLQANGVTRSRSDDAHLRAAVVRRFETGAVAHEVRFGATLSRGSRDQQRFMNAAGRTAAMFADDRLRPTTALLQIEDTFVLTPRFVGSIGIGRLEARRDVRERAGPARESFPSGAMLPAASVRWHVTREQVVFFSLSRVAEPPTFDDLVVTTGAHPLLVRRLQPLALQRAVTLEIGARGQFGPLRWDLAAYHAPWRNEILRLADARGNPRGATNVRATTHDGLETSLRWRVCERPLRVSLDGTAGWTRFTFDADPVYGGNRLAGIPPHFGAATLNVDFRHGGFLSTSVDWTAGATHVDHAGRLSYGGQARTNFRAGWRDAPYWTCFIEIQNVFDRATIASTAGVLDLARNPAATSIFLPAPGRGIVIGVEWRR